MNRDTLVALCDKLREMHMDWTDALVDLRATGGGPFVEEWLSEQLQAIRQVRLTCDIERDCLLTAEQAEQRQRKAHWEINPKLSDN